MVNKFVSVYLKRMLNDSQHQEESLEINADLIPDANAKWQKQREQAEALKTVLKMLK